MSGKKRASGSLESLDARAALPQNCSSRRITLLPILVNGTSGLDGPTNVPCMIAAATGLSFAIKGG
jgi:hypothetical protein